MLSVKSTTVQEKVLRHKHITADQQDTGPSGKRAVLRVSMRCCTARANYLASARRHKNDLLVMQLQQRTAGALHAMRAQPTKACTPIHAADIRRGSAPNVDLCRR